MEHDAKDSTMIFKVHRDGSIEKGPAYTTDSAAANKFYEALESAGMGLMAENAALKKEIAELKAVKADDGYTSRAYSDYHSGMPRR